MCNWTTSGTAKKHAIAALLIGLTLALPSRSWADGNIKGKVMVQGLRSAENVAVYVDAIPGKTFAVQPWVHPVVNQKNMKFDPRVLVVMKGTTVEFLNSDMVGHNIFWTSIGGNKKLAHNLGTWPQGQKKPFQFNDLGVVPLLCNAHSEMSGYIVVVPTPYFATTDSKGDFFISDVPPGRYTLKTWSAGGKPTSQDVDVTPSGASVTLTVKK
ncbi:MAG TPA: carboxypeptidase regulatory-like domain-containing protein [Bryobacteraceae bacterium]|jgi:plastocyanin|nr:carboxypeptidase regulatory-like domain-containing protein [Bryobacteraceae bacterium]